MYKTFAEAYAACADNQYIQLLWDVKVDLQLNRDLYVDFIRNGDAQQVQDVLVLSYGDYTKKAIHHGTGTWIENHKKLKGPYKDTKLKHLLRNYKIFDFIEHNWGKSAVSVYTFIAYDFLEMGVFYYIRRLFMKIKKRDK